MAKDDLKYIPLPMPNGNLTHCEQMGYECIIYGANTTNCDFRIFMTEAGKDAWERGKQRGIKQKLENESKGKKNGRKNHVSTISG